MGIRRESHEERYDVIVIGSGLGGLSAAALIAKEGKKVLVLERHDRAGGYAQSFQLKRYHFDAAVHLAGGCEGGMVDDLLLWLGVRDRVKFVRVNPFYTAMFPGSKVDIPAGVDEFIQVHAKQFPGEAKGVADLVSLSRQVYEEVQRFPAEQSILGLLRTPSAFPTLFKYRNSTLQSVMDHFMRDDKAKALFAALWPYLGLPPSKLSFVYWSVMLMSYLDKGAFYCQGTFQNLANALVEAVRNRDGEVLLLTRVRRIIVEKGSAAGVVLENGQKIRAPVVVSNVDARQTFEELVGEKELPGHYMRKLRGMRPSLSAFVLFLATDLDLQKLGASHEAFFYGSWDHDETYRSILKGTPAGIPVDVPSLIDPSLAPPGEHIIIATCLVPYEVGESWREKKDAYSKLMMDELEKVFPGLKEHTTFIEGGSPRTMERYTLNWTGAIYGWEVSPSQVGVGRLSHKTPIDGLYLSGHWTQPGGGVFGVLISGIQTAEMVLGRDDLFAELATHGQSARDQGAPSSPTPHP